MSRLRLDMFCICLMNISSVQIPQGTPEGSWWVREWATTLIEEVRWLSEQGWATTKSIQHLLEVSRSHMSIGLKFKIKARLSLCRMSANARRTCFGRLERWTMWNCFSHASHDRKSYACKKTSTGRLRQVDWKLQMSGHAVHISIHFRRRFGVNLS